MSNAEFFIYLAERGLSFAPHTPKRHSDRIGLYREICCAIRYLQHDVFYYDYLPDGQVFRAIESSLGQPFYPERPAVSAEAKCRIFQYFAPILSEMDKGWTALLID